jgi:tetratricopeptide (TPR) repeat protein
VHMLSSRYRRWTSCGLPLLLSLGLAWKLQAQEQSPPENSAPQSTTRATVQAKSKPEFEAYQSAVANLQNPDAMARAADDFAAKFPTSDLRVLLYRAAMHSYQSAGNSDKMMESGLKVLAIDKDDPEALIGVAEVQEERTTPMDLDREQRADQALANAQRALVTIDTDLTVPKGTPPDKVQSYKKYLRSMALSIVGTVQYKRQQYADAEANLRKAVESDPSSPDPVIILRLALALDQQKKYPQALQETTRAVELTKEDSDIGKMARSERERLLIQTGATNTGGTTSSGTSPQQQTPVPQPAPVQPGNSAPPSH